MGLFDKVEKGLERTVNRAFAKAFRSEVQPVEIAGAIRNAMDDRASVLGPGRTMVPNHYTIELSTTDFGRLDEYSDSITEDLIAAAAEHAETQRYLPGGPIEIVLAEGSDLDTGPFRRLRLRDTRARPDPRLCSHARGRRGGQRLLGRCHQQLPQARRQLGHDRQAGEDPRLADDPAGRRLRRWADDQDAALWHNTVLGREGRRSRSSSRSR